MAKTVVGEIMTRALLTLEAGSDLSLAEETMKLERVRHLPVVSFGKLVGLVSHRDLMKAHARVLAKAFAVQASGSGKHVVMISVDEVMQRDVRTISPDTTASEATRIIIENRFGCLPVVDGEELVGIVTEVDLLRWALTRLGPDA